MPSSALPDLEVAGPLRRAAASSPRSRGTPGSAGCPRRRCRRGSSRRGRRTPRRTPAARSRSPWPAPGSDPASRPTGRARRRAPSGPTWLGEQVGVRRPDERAVGRAEVAQLAVAERRAQHVDVLGHLDRGHVPDQVAALPQAVVAELGEQAVGVLRLGRGVRVGVGGDQGVELLGALALQRVARADAARVEPDDVEGGQQLGPERGRAGGGVLDAGASGAARVDDQRADPSLGVPGGHLEQRQLDRAARRACA